MVWRAIEVEGELIGTLNNLGAGEIVEADNLSPLACKFLLGRFRDRTKYDVWTEPPLNEGSGVYTLCVGRRIYHA